MRMEKLVAVALVGTARHHGQLDTTTGAPVDDLTTTLADAEPERALLLRAGAAAIYRQAGQVASAVGDTPTSAPAPAETRPICAPGVAMLLRHWFRNGNALLIEALTRLNHAGQRVPFDALPEALATQDDAVRTLLAPALGERGRWLSHFVAAWNWVDGALIEAKGELPPDADAIWQEGNLTARVALLRRARIVDPDLARRWVASVWKQEKAETRGELIACYEVNLSADDEPFLEAALDDRAGGVRETAARLLARLPGSAFATRARERADAMLTFDANAKLTSGANEDTITVKPPRDFKPEWARDGMTPKPDKSNEKGAGPRATWLTEAIALVNPSHWTERFLLLPDQLITAVEASDWSSSLCDGWTHAALAHQETQWMLPLWRWRHLAKSKRATKGARYAAMTSELTSRLFAGAPANTRRGIALDFIARYPVTIPGDARDFALDGAISAQQWLEAIEGAPRPWDDEFSDTYLNGLRAFAPQITPETLESQHEEATPWLATLDAAQTALAPSRVAAALEPLHIPPLPEGTFDWRITHAQQQLDEFTNVLRLRQELLEEIPG